MSARTRRAWLAEKCSSRNTYQSREDASRSASFVRARGGPRLVPYSCEICGGWHNFAPKESNR